MRKVWTPDEIFLNGLRRDELVQVAKDSGAIEKTPRIAEGTKKALVQGLVAYFKRTADSSAQLDVHERKGSTWLPTCMTLVGPNESA